MTPRRFALVALAIASATAHLALWLQFEDTRRGLHAAQAKLAAHRCPGGIHA